MSIKRVNAYYSDLLKRHFETAEEAEQQEALEKICARMNELVRLDEEHETELYFFQQGKPVDPLQILRVFKDAAGLKWTSLLKIIERNK